MLGADIIERMGPYQLLHHYLSASYCYYQMDLSPLTDPAFDLLCKRLQTVLDRIEDDPHHSLVDAEQLAAGTGYYIPEQDYPRRIADSASVYYHSCVSGEMAKRLQSFLKPAVQRRVMARTPPAKLAPKRVGRTPPKPVAVAPVVKRISRTIR